MQTRERRSSDEGIAEDLPGVGGRHGYMGPLGGGGGYLDICTQSEPPVEARKKIAADPRIDELRQMGLNRHWVDLADRLGFDAFMLIWDTLEEMPKQGTQLVHVPKKSLYFRYQRNRLILSLGDEGKKSPEIHQELKKLEGNTVSRRHIDRILATSPI